MPTESVEIQEAFRHHKKRCAEMGAPAPTPDGGPSSVEEIGGRRYAVLRNLHGKILAVYEAHPNLTFTPAPDGVAEQAARR